MKKITKEQLIEKLQKLSTSRDLEASHSQADDFLLQYINDKEVSRVYNDLDKWYA